MANNNQQEDSNDDLLYQWALTMDTNGQVNVQETEEDEEQQQLSQKLSQLSASGTDDRQTKETSIAMRNKRLSADDTSNITSKKLKTTLPKNNDGGEDANDDNNEGVEEIEVEDQIPNYLSIADNSTFQKFIQTILSKTANSYTIDDFQIIAILLREITLLDLKKSLWNIYLQSGTGQLAENQLLSTAAATSSSAPFCIWPTELKSIIFEEQVEKRQQQQLTVTNVNLIDGKTCHRYVQQMIHQFIEQQMHYQNQLYEKKAQMYKVLTAEIEESIIQFLEQQELNFTRIECDTKIAIIKFNYRDQWFLMKFEELEPHDEQLHLFEYLAQLKREKEQSIYELFMLKQRAHYNFLPEPLNSLDLPLYWSTYSTSSIDKITDEETRQNLLRKHQKIIRQTKSDMMSFYMSVASTKMYECQGKFNAMLPMIKPMPHFAFTTTDQSLSPAMVTILTARFKNIDERFEYLSNLKKRYLEQKQKTNLQ